MSFQFASDFTEKTLFKTLMIRLLRTEIGHSQDLNMSLILEEEILHVDDQLLDIARSTNEVSGMKQHDFFCSS